MSLPKLTESMIRAGASAQSFQRGQEYYAGGAISNTAIQGHVLTGECEGTSAPYYSVRVELDEGGVVSAYCTCPYEFGGYCKHVVALLLTCVHHPKKFITRQEPAKLLADLDRDDLLALVTKLVEDRPDLYDTIEAAIAVPSSSDKKKKTRRKPVDVNVYRRQVRNILHSLDGMRASEAYWHVGGLANELRSVRDTAMKFLDADDAATALEILLTLADEASDGIEYIDDSNGELGGFMDDLGGSLAEAILSLEMSEVERKKLITRLKEIADHAGDYGVEGGLELALEAAKTGWNEAPAESTGKRSTRRQHDFDDEDEDDEEFDDEAYGEEDEYWDEGQGAGWWRDTLQADLTEAKLNVLERQERVEEYLALCKQAGRHLRYALKLCDLKRVPEAVTYATKHLTAADEALAMAKRLREGRHVDEALSIGERGLQRAGSKAELGAWLGALEEAQGRTGQALQAWLAALRDNASLDTYKIVKRLAGAQWSKLQADVMKALHKFGDQLPLAEVLLFEQEWDEAIKVAEQRSVWYQVIEVVADGVIKHRPEWAAKMSIKQAERLMVEVKSQNYPIAANWLKKAKKAYQHMGQMREWQAYLDKIKEQYKRRSALQKQLRQL